MALTPKPRNSIQSVLVPVACCFLSIVLMSVWALEGQSGALHTVKQGAATVLVPFEIASAGIGRPLNNLSDAISDGNASPATLGELEQENSNLRGQLVLLEEYRKENERLNALLHIQAADSSKTVGARVIMHSLDIYNRVLTIDKGSNDGMAVSMPVLNANGLIGQIESVGAFSSTVRLLTDQNSSASVFLQRTHTDAIITGSAEGLLYLDFLPAEVNVEVGEAIITSGAGGVYPKGLVIGHVAKVEKTNSDIYQKVLVNPLHKVNSYEEVLVQNQ